AGRALQVLTGCHRHLACSNEKEEGKKSEEVRSFGAKRRVASRRGDAGRRRYSWRPRRQSSRGSRPPRPTDRRLSGRQPADLREPTGGANQPASPSPAAFPSVRYATGVALRLSAGAVAVQPWRSPTGGRAIPGTEVVRCSLRAVGDFRLPP